MKLKFIFEYDTTTGEMSVTNTETGEVKSETVKKSATRSKTKIKEESSEPELILEENKYALNTAALELLNVGSDDRLDIKYIKDGATFVPVIATNTTFGTKGGNKLTKSGTVSFRGKNNEELSEYGTVFKLVEMNPGVFKLVGDKAPQMPIIEDQNIEVPDDEDDFSNISLDDISDLVNDDESVTEVNAFDFNL